MREPSASWTAGAQPLVPLHRRQSRPQGSDGASEGTYSYYRYENGALRHLETVISLDGWLYSDTTDHYVGGKGFRPVSEDEANAVRENIPTKRCLLRHCGMRIDSVDCGARLQLVQSSTDITASDPLLTQNTEKACRAGRKQWKTRRANGGKKGKSEPKRLDFLETTYGPEGRGFESLTAYQKSSKSF